ncbi:MAG: hypothetical protein ACO1SV_08785 [Fimbriimonas sp.]
MTQPFQLVLPFDGRRKAVVSKSIRRCVRRVHLDPLPDGTYLFRARSFTRQRGSVYRCRVNPTTGFVWCNCRDFQFRHAGDEPTYWSGHVCKHLERAKRTVRQVERDRQNSAALEDAA